MCSAIPRYYRPPRRTNQPHKRSLTNVNRASRRYYRTIVLAVLAMASLIWVAMDQFGISRQEMTELFIGTVLIAVLAITCAAVLTLLWVGLRKLLRRGEDYAAYSRTATWHRAILRAYSRSISSVI